MSDDIPYFHLARVYSDGAVEPLVYPVGALPLDTVANRRGILGAGAITAGAFMTAVSTPALAQQKPESGEIEGAEKCAAAEAAGDRNRAHASAIVDLQVDEPTSTVITRDAAGTVKFWHASRLALELSADLGSAIAIRACGYVLKRTGSDALAGKVVRVTSSEIVELELPEKRFSTLVRNGVHLGMGTSSIHFIDNRTALAVIGRTLTYYDINGDRIRLSIMVPGVDQELTAGVSRDRQWLALMDAHGVQLWSIYRGVRMWHRPFDEPRPGQPAAGVRQSKAIGFLSGDRYVISAVNGRHITIQDRKTGEIIVRRSLLPGESSAAIQGSRATDITELGADNGLKVVWDAGFGPSLWNLRRLTRRCSLAVEPAPSASAGQQYGILSGLKRGFAISGFDHVMAWNLEQGSFAGYLKDPELAKPPAPPPPTTTYKPPVATPSPPPSTYNPPSPNYGVGGGVICTCNKVCTCIPVMRCQAHELLDDDAVVRTMAEELLLGVELAGFEYMRWAAEAADAALADRIRNLMTNIAAGRPGNPHRWPDAQACLDRLNGARTIGLMSAQWLQKLGVPVPPILRARVEHLLADGHQHSWKNLAQTGYRAHHRRAGRTSS
jgi:hypothetical protein